MAINFCMPQYSPSIWCNKVSADDFEVENLISSDVKLLKNGFRCESFIKPPVEVVVTFPLSIDISSVILGLGNGTQQVTVVKLLTKFRTTNDDNMDFDFKLIGKFDNIKSSEICLENHKYRQNKKFAEVCGKIPTFAGFPCTDIRKLYSRMDADVCCVRQLKVCLLKAANSGVVVLTKLQVWGQAAKDCSTAWINRILNFERSQKSSELSIRRSKDFTPPNSIGDIKNYSPESVVEHELVIPNEFLDSITLEIMTLPMVLPSGNNIDQSTLEKCNKMQATWGRNPIDPFTGIPLRGENQPIFNAALKTRIDEFLIRNQKFLNVPRTLGMMKGMQQGWRKSTLYSTVLPRSETAACNDVSLKANSTMKKICSWKRSVEGDNVEKKKIRLHVNSSIHNSAYVYCDKANSRKESLKKDIEDVLGSLRRFTEVSENKNDFLMLKRCAICDPDVSESMFQLPCSHVLCRSCLVRRLKIQPTLCNICNVAFTSESVTRVFL